MLRDLRPIWQLLAFRLSSEEHANAADVFGQAAAILKREGGELDD